MSSIADELLLDVVERGGPPHERANRTVFVAQDGDIAQRRMRRWRERIAGGSEQRFDEYLRRAGIDHATLLAGLADVSLSDRSALPAWAYPLGDMIAALRSGSSDPLLDGARTWLREQPWAEGVAADAQEGMLATLRARVWRIVEPVADYDRRAEAAVNVQLGVCPKESERDAWLERLRIFPGLGYVLGCATLHWRVYMSEIQAHLLADRALVAERLFGGVDPGLLVAFHGDTGDRHRKGRAVAILTFEDGRRVAYKPKDLRCAAAFLDLAAGFGLHARAIVVREDHAWEEMVDPQPCASEQEAGRFFERMGMLIRLLQLLEGRDFWLDNLVAHGDQPVFIDLETLLQPRVAQPGTLGVAQRAYDIIAESAVLTGAITMPTPIAPGIDAEDLGALTGPRRYLTPFRRWGGGDDEAGDYATWSHPEHVPRLEGRPVPASRHLDDLLGGYAIMQRRLASSREDLLASGGPLARLRDAPVRFIARDTWTYQKLVQRSVAPPQLVDGTERELFLAQLHRLGGHEAARDPLAVCSEITALRDMDVPYFASLPSSDALLMAEGAALPGYFDGTAWSRLTARIAALDEHVDVVQLDMMRSAFAIGHDPCPTVGASKIPGPPAPASLDWIAEAVALGDWILDQAAVRESSGERAWIGLVYEPRMRICGLLPLGSDLLTGTSGLALLFADLHRTTGHERFLEAARQALAGADPPEPPLSAQDLRAPPASAGQTMDLLVAIDDALALGDRERAAEHGSRLLSMRRESGSWFAHSFAADRHQLSIVWGVPAVARAFLRLGNPHSVGSLRARASLSPATANGSVLRG